MAKSLADPGQSPESMPHGKVIACGIAAALCLAGPWAVERAVGGDHAGEIAKPARASKAPAPSQPALLISATGYGLDAPVAPGFVEPTPEVAYQINQARPLAAGPNPAARPFAVAWRDDFDHGRAVDCLTAAVYYEAALEGDDGQRAVAQVVLNRVRHPAFAKSVCAVVFEGADRTSGCQFTFTCDGSLARRPEPALWERARKVATAALNGSVYKPVGYATHYHTVWVAPYWAPSLAKVANIGLHIFYRWEGGWGTAPAFTTAGYVADETRTDMRKLAAVAPVPLFQKAVLRTRIEPDARSMADEAPAAPIPTLSVQAKPIEIASIGPALSLPAMPQTAPEMKTLDLPSTTLTKGPAFSRLAVPAGW